MLQHKHLLVKATIANHISDTSQISNWISELVNTIQMKILHGPVSVYCDKVGNKGVTAFAIIETSHIVLHTWDETDPACLQLDVYTCSNLEIDLVIKSLLIFQPTKLNYKFLDREYGFTEINDTPVHIVEKWITRLSIRHSDLGNHKICPFAKMPTVIPVKQLCLEEFTNLSHHIAIYMENGIISSYADLVKICKDLRNMYPTFVFLPDHPYKINYINGHATGNGVFPCIIVQTKSELEIARKSLSKTNYYHFWDEDYINEISSFN
jgi:S-adenosylmethionine/arginine decarboxylase-like enzyme